MKTNKVMSWSAAIFIGLSFVVLFAPLVYLFAVGKSERQWSLGLGGIDIFSVTSHNSGSFEMSYGMGAILVPAVLSVLVWGLLTGVAKRRSGRRRG